MPGAASLSRSAIPDNTARHVSATSSPAPRLDPFRNGFQPQALRHLNDVLGNQVAGAVGG